MANNSILFSDSVSFVNKSKESRKEQEQQERLVRATETMKDVLVRSHQKRDYDSSPFAASHTYGERKIPDPISSQLSFMGRRRREQERTMGFGGVGGIHTRRDQPRTRSYAHINEQDPQQQENLNQIKKVSLEESTWVQPVRIVDDETHIGENFKKMHDDQQFVSRKQHAESIMHSRNIASTIERTSQQQGRLFLDALIMQYQRFMRNPFYHTVRLALKPLSMMAGMFGRWLRRLLMGRKSTDTEKIIASINKQTNIIRKGATGTEGLLQTFRQRGIMGLIGRGTRSGIGRIAQARTGESAQEIEQQRAQGERKLSKFDKFRLSLQREQVNLLKDQEKTFGKSFDSIIPDKLDEIIDLIEKETSEIKSVSGILMDRERPLPEPVSYKKVLNVAMDSLAREVMKARQEGAQVFTQSGEILKDAFTGEILKDAFERPYQHGQEGAQIFTQSGENLKDAFERPYQHDQEEPLSKVFSEEDKTAEKHKKEAKEQTGILEKIKHYFKGFGKGDGSGSDGFGMTEGILGGLGLAKLGHFLKRRSGRILTSSKGILGGLFGAKMLKGVGSMLRSIPLKIMGRLAGSLAVLDIGMRPIEWLTGERVRPEWGEEVSNFFKGVRKAGERIANQKPREFFRDMVGPATWDYVAKQLKSFGDAIGMEGRSVSERLYDGFTEFSHYFPGGKYFGRDKDSGDDDKSLDKQEDEDKNFIQRYFQRLLSDRETSFRQRGTRGNEPNNREQPIESLRNIDEQPAQLRYFQRLLPDYETSLQEQRTRGDEPNLATRQRRFNREQPIESLRNIHEQPAQLPEARQQQGIIMPSEIKLSSEDIDKLVGRLQQPTGQTMQPQMMYPSLDDLGTYMITQGK